ncbi:MAG: transglycosylase SLT domain-containing protein [Candidatus Taylorbacteria bacterium]|nr:transglycosylase SLT domain-containing protein [Candidatus Taylorbacteria bacterium]
MHRNAIISALILGYLLFPSPSFAATDPIAAFCSSAQAQADQEAKRQCEDYARSVADSQAKKSEKDEAQAAIDKINAEIRVAEQKIKLQNTIINRLSSDIGAKTKVVSALEGKIDRNTGSIRSVIQKVNVKDSVSLPEIMLSGGTFSDFYTQADQYVSLNKELTALLDEVRSQKDEVQSEKEELEDRKDREFDAKQAIEAEKRLIERKKTEKNAILALKTSEYNVAQKILTDQKQKVAQIRARLFKFQDGEGIPFGNAYDYAVKAGKVTGVRPAFVLGILMQESSYDSSDSSFGKNVGQCFVRDRSTGEGVSASTGAARIRVMNPTRDLPVFMDIVGNLGFDWTNTRVSCWITAYSGGKPFGWGGAMGPAQFIPSTWQLYQKRIAKGLGISVEETNPWNPEHAIMAASYYLGDLGAGLQTYSAEKNAACQYYSGRKCASSTAGNTYGTSVMKWVTKVQEEMIDPILGR